jgi:nucleoid-associated protein YgaU
MFAVSGSDPGDGSVLDQKGETSMVIPSDRPSAFWMKQAQARRIRAKRRLRRQRILAVAASLLVGGVALSRAFAGGDRPTAVPAHPAPVILVTVAPGDTLWGLAQHYGNPDMDVVQRVQAISAANGGHNGALQVGQHLRIPVTHPIELAKLHSRLALLEVKDR